MKIAVIALASLLFLGVGFFVGMKFFGSGGGDSATAEEKVEEVKPPSETAVYPLDTFIVNLAGEGGRRYLKTKMTLEIDSADKDKIDEKIHRIKDSMITLLSSKTFDEIREVSGKYSLRKEINGRINKIVGKGVVKEVYLVEFVVQ